MIVLALPQTTKEEAHPSNSKWPSLFVVLRAVCFVVLNMGISFLCSYLKPTAARLAPYKQALR